jgi:hypothetical protein
MPGTPNTTLIEITSDSELQHAGYLLTSLYQRLSFDLKKVVFPTAITQPLRQDRRSCEDTSRMN